MAAFGLALLAFDALLYNRTGFHISFQAADLLKNEAQNQIGVFSWQQWVFLLLLFLVWFGFQLVLANAIWKRVEKFSQFKVGMPVASLFVTCFAASHIVHVWADANLYQPIIKQDNMFPLSYPATAKTTMSRYGLLDLTAYQERKALQFDSTIHQIRYPSQPVYCSIDTTRDFSVLVQIDDAEISASTTANLTQFDQFYTTATSVKGLVNSVLFGVPEIYQASLDTARPVLLALPTGFGMPVSVYADTQYLGVIPKSYASDAFTEANGLSVAFLTASQIESFLNSTNTDEQNIIVATGFGDAEKAGSLFTNLNIAASVASTEDLAPTVLGVLGCNASPSYYSTGQNLVAPSRNWLVSTSGERVVVLHNGIRTEVLSNGSYTLTNASTLERSNEQLNVDLLSQAIKHLSMFSSQN
ncbi:hypothetical protein KUL49_15440 [Alteromonas sp. KUL49]|nr:hypothetical protein KUL49_15440 [Alteromonas sp. KUL49]